MKNFIFDLQIFDNVTLVIGDYTFGSGNTTLKPSTGVVNIALKRGNTTILSGKVECTSGKITFGNKVTFAKGTNLNLTLSKNGKTIFDGKLNVNGTIYLDNNVLTVAKGTKFNIDFGNNYSVSLKATDDAGGTISLGENGITFAPNSDDGGLEIAVTRDGETRTASLDVTGSVTYKLDGSISLTKNTVVKNIFEDGNVLTITAKTDASGSIVLSPKNGLNITPNESNALDLLLSRDGEGVIEISGVTGSVTYRGGAFTASDGTELHFVDPKGIYNDNALRTSGGTTTVHFGENGIDYTPGKGATFTMDYLEGTTWELQNGTLTDYFSGPVQGNIYLSEGSTFDTNDSEYPFALEKAGEYILNGVKITTTEDATEASMSGYNAVEFSADAGVTVSTIDGGKFFEISEGDDTIQISANKDFTVTNGTITLDGKELSATAGTTVTFAKGTTFTADKNISADYKVEDDIYYFELDEAKVSVKSGEISGDLKLGGVVSYRPETKTFGLTGANSSHGNGENTSAEITFDSGYSLKIATSDTTVVFIPTISDGKLNMSFPNKRKHALRFTLSKDGQVAFDNNLIIDGTVGFDPTKQEISLKKGTTLTLGDSNELVITALDDAGGQLTFTDDGIKFSPNEGDGALELNFVSAERKANLNITGAVIFGENGKISLDDGTEIDITWEDGNNLKLTSSGSTGSIEFDSEKGIKITSDDENLNIELTMANGYSTTVSGLKGSLWYNAGKVLLDEGTKLTGTGTLNNRVINVTLETVDGDAYLDFSTSDGFVYGADTGKLKVTYALGKQESTFTVNKGSVLIGNGISKISEGTDVATDLKNFIPVMNFTTEEAGTYTINGQTITTTKENLALKATDNYMSFVTSDDVVEYDGMTFAGAGNVSLTPDNVVLGEGVAASGFGEENSFVLAEAGNVTADAKIFELTELKDLPREIPMKITVQGAKDGFIFSRTLTKESEAYLDDALDEDSFKNYTSPYIGKVFTEKFISAGDSSYRIRTDAIGLEEVIGISDGATINGGAILDNEPSLSYYNLVTDTEGKFTIGEKTYTIGGDSNVAIRARFEVDNAPYASYVDSLSGTVSGDFTGGQFSINGSSGMQVLGDTNIDILADEDGFEISGLDEGAGLQVAAADTYTVNGTALKADAGDIIIGSQSGNSAYISENIAGLSITNFENDSIITATNFADTIENYGENVKINSLGGKDTVTNFGASSFINGGADSDSIINGGASVTINGGDGDDSIQNGGDFTYNNVSINAGAGDDYIFNEHAYYPTLEGGAGNDKIVVTRGHHTYIDGGAGDDTILGEKSSVSAWEMGGYATIHGGDGDDYINPVFSDSAYISGGDGNDTIQNEGNDSTISGGAGDDVISLQGSSLDNNIIQYEIGDGNDIIFGFNETSQLSLSAGAEFSSVESGDNVILTVNENKITITGAATLENINVTNSEVTALDIDNNADNTLISGTFLDDNIQNSGENVTINGAAGKDTINNDGDESAIDAGAGNDIITNTGANSTVNGAEGDDNITNSADNVLIEGSYGNDRITNSGENATIKPGGGHDVITNTADKILIDYTGGSDTISGLGENSTLKIAGDFDTIEGITNVVVESGDNFIILANALLNTDAININGEKITLSKAIDLTYEGENISINRDNVTISGNGGDDTITNTGANVVFNYAEGDGNDIIFGFNETSTLNISDADYTSIKSGNDIIVTVGENTITLKDAQGGRIDDGRLTTEEFITSVMGNKAKVQTVKGSGDENISMKNYNVVVVTEEATGEKNISLSGGNLAIVENTKAQVSITAGDDTVASQGDNVYINTNGEATKIFAQSGKMTVDNYNATTGAGFLTDYADIFTAMDANKILYDGKTLTIGSAEVIDGTGGNSIMNVYDTSGRLQKLGSVQDNGELNLSDEKDNFIVGVGENATFTGGAGNDSIFAFSGSRIDGGEGVNYIRLEDDATGVELAFNESSKNTVDNFQTGFDETSDKIIFGADEVANFKIDGADLMIRKPNNSHCGVLKDVASSFVNILTADENSTQKVTVIREGSKIKVDELADLYKGENSGVDFTNYTGELVVNLGTTKAESVGSGEILFGGINQVTLGSGQGILLGSNAGETLTAGTGASTISGGAGADKLVGKSGETTFIFSVGDENDTISNFDFGTDIIETDGEIQSVGTSGNNAVIALNGEDKLTIENGARKNFNIKVGETEFNASVTSGDLVYNSAINYFNTSKKSASISASGEDVTMWLNGDEGLRNTLGKGVQFGGDIKYISAAKSGGSAMLAGNENIDNVITASKGNSTLWGGGASNDTLIGGAGVDEFYYMRGNGDDVIQNATAGDAVILDGMEMSDVASTEVNGGAITLNFSDGGRLTADISADFKLNGATYTTDASGNWTRK